MNFSASATDVHDPDPTVDCVPPSGSTFPIGETLVTCTATDDADNSSLCTFTVTVDCAFQLPADSNQDGTVNLSDVIHLLLVLFRSDAPSLPCGTAAANLALVDYNNDGGINISDVIYKLAFLFQGGAPPMQGVDSCVIG